MGAIEIRGLRVVRGGETVLPGLSAEVTAGRVTSLPARVTQGRGLGAWFVFDVVVVIGTTLLALVCGAATLRRRTA